MRDHALVFLPFQSHFHAAIRDGRKTMTCRSKKYGEAGDVVDSPIGPLRFTKVEPVKLGVVADDHWRNEGCNSTRDFIQVWNQIHPRKRFHADTIVFAHTFEVVRGG